MGDDSTLFITDELKMYTPSKDQSIFGPLRRLSGHILESIGLNSCEVTDHIKATDGIDPYHTSPPHHSQAVVVPSKTQGPSITILPTLNLVPYGEEQSSQPKPKRRKQIVCSKKAPRNIVRNGENPSKKRKSRVVESSDETPPSPSESHDIRVNVKEGADHDSNDLFRRKKLKLTHSHRKMCDQTHIAVSRKTLIVLGAPT